MQRPHNTDLKHLPAAALNDVDGCHFGVVLTIILLALVTFATYGQVTILQGNAIIRLSHPTDSGNEIKHGVV